jgi:hypothetical protein
MEFCEFTPLPTCHIIMWTIETTTFQTKYWCTTTGSTACDHYNIHLSPLKAAEKSSENNWYTWCVTANDDDHHKYTMCPFNCACERMKYDGHIWFRTPLGWVIWVWTSVEEPSFNGGIIPLKHQNGDPSRSRQTNYESVQLWLHFFQLR